jgi:phosphatidylinositol alpha-1,6-mannosyltransferase
VFHATGVFPVGFFTVLIGKFILRKPVVVTFYGTDVLTNQGSTFTKWAKGFTVRHASKCIAASNSTRDLVTAKYKLPLNAAQVIYPLISDISVQESNDADSLREQYGIAPDDFVVLYVGNLVRRKGADLLVEAIAKIPDASVKLIIVGAGPERERIEQKIVEHDVKGRVTLTGRVPDVEPYYRIAGAFSMPAFFERDSDDIEGLGIVYLEAQQRGVPVVGTRSGGIPEAIDDGKSGFLVAEKDVEGLARSIRALKEDPDMCRSMGARGREFVKEKFNSKESAAEHVALYRLVSSAK